MEKIQCTTAEFIEVAKTLKLTPLQSKIVKMLENGYRLSVKNPHYANGGEIVWYKDENYSYAGHIYHALQHLQWKIENSCECNLDIIDLYVPYIL